MDKDTILDYVIETPGNTNRAVLGDMLDSFAGGGGGGGVNLHTATLTFVGSSDTAVINLHTYLDESTGYLENNQDAPFTGSYTIPLFNAEGGRRNIFHGYMGKRRTDINVNKWRHYH